MLSPFASQIHSLIRFWLQFLPVYSQALLNSCPELNPNSEFPRIESLPDSFMSIVNEYYVMSVTLCDLEFDLSDNNQPNLVLISNPALLEEILQSLQNSSVVSFTEVSVFYGVVQAVIENRCEEIDLSIVQKILDYSPNYLLTNEEQAWLIEMPTISRFFELTREHTSCCVFSYYLNNVEWSFGED